MQPLPPQPSSKVGIALSTLGDGPINGLRIAPSGDTNGWYLWCGGEFSDDPSFFQPLHIEHVPEYLPLAIDYLVLPPGHRFQIDAKGYEDVWFDAALLEQRG